MNSTRKDALADQLVKGHAIRRASQVGGPTPESGDQLVNTKSILASPRDVGESTLASDVEDDGISPGDALDFVLGEDSEEVRV